MANKNMKRHSTLLIIREMQIKTEMRYHFTVIRMPITRETTNNKSWRKCGEKVTLLQFWQEYKLVQPIWSTVCRFLKKLEIKLPYDPAILLLSTYPEKTTSQKDTCTPIFIVVLFTTARNKPSCPPTDEWLKTLWYVYTIEYCSAIKRYKFESVLVKWMNLEPACYTELSKSEI